MLVDETLTPLTFAMNASRGQWKPAPHLALIDYWLLQARFGNVKRITISTPPRHGKSSFISQYTSGWWYGSNPLLDVMILSYGDTLADEWSGKAKGTFAHAAEPFFGLKLDTMKRRENDWGAYNRKGRVRSAGLNAGYTGKGAHLLLVDDPVRNSTEAQSEHMRNRTWETFISTAYSRLEPDAVIVAIGTRWHQDDCMGRMIELFKREDKTNPYININLPAIAEADEPCWPLGLGRRRGQALWPERYPIAALESIKRTMTAYWWSALYQGNPTPDSGGLFLKSYFPLSSEHAGFAATVRFWDFASTEKRNDNDPDWTVGTLMSRGVDGNYYVRDVRRFRESPAKTEALVLATARADGPNVHVWGEEEGGSSGKIASMSYVRAFQNAGMGMWSVRFEKATGSKVVRADPFAAAAENGLVRCVLGIWDYGAWVNEFRAFPTGTHDDQVDSASGAYSKLFIPRTVQPAIGLGWSSDITQYVPR